jgi:cytochrome c-type biogenesis protein CcmE
MSVHPDAPVLDDEDLPPVVTPTAGGRRVRKGRLAFAVVALVGALIFIVLQAGDATVYFRTVDEAVAQRQALGTKRFRLEGVVQSGTITQTADALRFRIYGDHGATADIVHRGGQPTGLFRDDIPVVLEGRWASEGTTFLSDRVIVKHSETYRVENPERLEKYPPPAATTGGS